MSKIIGYTIKSTSPEGTYFLVNGWYKHFAFWIRNKEIETSPEKYLPMVTFKTIGSSKTNLVNLLKIMPDYKTDKFTVCYINENGIISPIN